MSMDFPYSATPEPYTQQTGPSTRAVVALVLGIVGVLGALGSCCCCFLLAVTLCSPVALILGWLERRDIDAGLAPAAGRSLATAAMILGAVGILLVFLDIVSYIVRGLMVGWEPLREQLRHGGFGR